MAYSTSVAQELVHRLESDLAASIEDLALVKDEYSDQIVVVDRTTGFAYEVKVTATERHDLDVFPVTQANGRAVIPVSPLLFSEQYLDSDEFVSRVQAHLGREIEVSHVDERSVRLHGTTAVISQGQWVNFHIDGRVTVDDLPPLEAASIVERNDSTGEVRYRLSDGSVSPLTTPGAATFARSTPVMAVECWSMNLRPEDFATMLSHTLTTHAGPKFRVILDEDEDTVSIVAGTDIKYTVRQGQFVSITRDEVIVTDTHPTVVLATHAIEDLDGKPLAYRFLLDDYSLSSVFFDSLDEPALRAPADARSLHRDLDARV